MKVKILGCSGSETIGHKPPGFLVNDVLMLDAGTITAALTIEEQVKITDVLISHAHLDHIKSVLFLADNVLGFIKKPVNIHAIPEVIDAIQKHLMNDVIWPDFTKIRLLKNPRNPVLAYVPMPLDKPVTIAGLKVRAIPMNHPVPSVGFQVSNGKSSFIYSADTGPSERLWDEAARAKNLKAIIVDTSFPRSHVGIAGVSGHFTTAQLNDDLNKAKLNNGVPIYICHVKPVYEKKVTGELKALGRKNVKILQEGKTYNF